MKRLLLHTLAVLVTLGFLSSAGLAGKPGCQVGAETKQPQTRQRPKACASTPAPPTSSETIEGMVAIQVSPRTLIIGAPVQSLTVHVDIPFIAVLDTEPVALNEIEATLIFADDRGDLVAKFPFETFEAVAQEQELSEITLLLTGTAVDGPFDGEATIPVRERGRRGPSGQYGPNRNPGRFGACPQVP